MSGVETLNLIGALVTMAMGGLGLLAPNLAAKLVRLGVQQIQQGFAEFRATYGGLFVAFRSRPSLMA